MVNSMIIKAGILGVIAVIGGAFGAHALKEILSTEHLASFNTGVRYQMIHAVVLLLLSLLYVRFDLRQFKIAATLIFWGVILFSGSIYLLTLKNILEVEILKFAGPITPLGGTLIIIGWIFIIVGGVKLGRVKS
jgi:uncharacterized membrane protein YgdD (TMEM256/DUF423 family)